MGPAVTHSDTPAACCTTLSLVFGGSTDLDVWMEDKKPDTAVVYFHETNNPQCEMNATDVKVNTCEDPTHCNTPSCDIEGLCVCVHRTEVVD